MGSIHQLKDRFFKTLDSTMLLPRDTAHRQRLTQAEEKQMVKTLSLIWINKEADVSTFISDKVRFKPKLIKRDKEGHFIMLKGETKMVIS